MKLFAPKYYTDFACIADRCRHSCCVGWEIDIDNCAMNKYRTLSHPYGTAIRKSIESDDTPHFRLTDDSKCPHLDESGLCRIICNVGEDHLCDICREHPRFYSFSARGGFVGLGLSCEEACRIILSSDSYSEFVPISELAEDIVADFDPIDEIEKLYLLLSDRSVQYRDRLARIAESYSLPDDFTVARRNEILSCLEYLDPSHEKLLRDAPSASFSSNLDVVCERALAYFIFRHCSAAENASEFRSALGFSLFCENLLRSLAADGGDYREIARIISEELEYSEDNTDCIKTEFLF